eukprot:scaffold2868_cov171-Amphora_coffeaeformis.AAC.3
MALSQSAIEEQRQQQKSSSSLSSSSFSMMMPATATTTTRRLLFVAWMASQLVLPASSQNITDMPTFAPVVGSSGSGSSSSNNDTLVPTLAPSAAETNTTAFPPCSLCPLANQDITNLSGRYNERTCEAWSMDATQGILSPEQCTTLQASVAFQAVCDCATEEEEEEVMATQSPTTSPTASATTTTTTTTTTELATIETTVVMVLSNVTVAMSPVHRNYFGPQLALYLERELRKTTSLGPGWEGQLESQLLLDEVPSGELSSARRNLLRVEQNHDNNNNNKRDLQITVSAPLATKTIIKAKQNVDQQPPLDTAQLELFVTDVLLKDRGAGFLAQLINTTSPTLVVYFEKIRDITLFPSDSFEDFQPPAPDDDDDDDDDGFFTLWTIVVIAGGIGLCLLVVALVLLCVMQPETVQNSPRAAANNNYNDTNSPRGGFSTSPTKAPSSKAGATTNGAKRLDNAEDDTTYYGNASVLNPPTLNPHDDNQSYAYSLEPATFDNATLGGGQQPSWKTTPQPNPSSSSTGAAAAATGATAGATSTAAAAADAPSLAPDDSRSIYTTRRGPMVLRDIQAPPGKLGIVIDTSLEGPVVHKVNENSPLLGKIFTGDIITCINGIDTRAMKASAITGIMVRTAHEPRALTVASEDTTMK